MNRKMYLILILSISICNALFAIPTHLLYKSYPSITSSSLSGSAILPVHLSKFNYGDIIFPLYIVFDSKYNNKKNKMRYWFFPMQESKAYLINESELFVQYPNGTSSIFIKNKNTFKSIGVDSINPLYPELTAQVKKNKIILTSECGWKLIFVNGRLKTISKDDTEILFEYNKDEFKICSKKYCILSLKKIDSGYRLLSKDLSFDFLFEDNFLSKIRGDFYADFNYSKMGKEFKLEYKIGDANKSYITWNDKNNLISSDVESNYTIKKNEIIKRYKEDGSSVNFKYFVKKYELVSVKKNGKLLEKLKISPMLNVKIKEYFSIDPILGEINQSYIYKNSGKLYLMKKKSKNQTFEYFFDDDNRIQ